MKMNEYNRAEIFYTIIENNYEKFIEELKSLENINVVDINGMSLLHFCAEYSRLNFAYQLINKGIKIDIKDKYGNSALWKATFNSRGNYSLVELLIENGANPNSKNNVNKSPFELAISFKDERLIGLLSEPEFKYYADWLALAEMFNYEICRNDQEWTYTISEPERIDDYLNAYNSLGTIEAKFSLMEMIIQSVNDQPKEKFKMYWERLIPILEIDFELNKPTIYYWCSWMNESLEDCFRISKEMREYWIRKIKEKML